MPLQNRVAPTGEIFRSSARGTLMGNRGGALHNEAREIVRSFTNKRWITCLLEFKGRRRSVMTPGQYTELFFLDEAVALAAGHRPCAECRRERFNEFKDVWKRAHAQHSPCIPGVDEMDARLHPKRIDRLGAKVTYEAPLDSLPDGCFVSIDSCSYLLWKGVLLLWSAEGYREKLRATAISNVTVLTPEPLIQCIRGGFVPGIHESSQSL
jgi:hypothetical protein